MADSRLAEAAAITGWNSHMLAKIVGLGSSTVRAYQCGRLAEHLDGRQLLALRRALALYRDKVIDAVDAFDMMT